MKEINKVRIELGLLFLLLLIIMPRTSMDFDFQMWKRWALYIHHNGLTNAYGDPTVSYYPVYLYIIYLYDLVMGSDALITQNIVYLKCFTLVFDFLPVIILCCFRQNFFKDKVPYLFLLLNIAYLFNTVVWGQIDSIHTSLIFLSILYAFDRPMLSIVLYAIAFATKPQAIIFLPIVILLLLYNSKSIGKLINLILIGIAAELIVLSPFLIAGKAGDLIYVATHFVNYFRCTSIGAFNIWYLVLKNAYLTMDYEKIGSLTYQQVGYIMFFGSSAVIMLLLLFRIAKLRFSKTKPDDDTLQLLMLSSGLIALYFFYFNTQMHERYSHPMLLFFFFYGVCSKNYKVFFLASIPYLLSLDKCYPDYFPIKHYKIFFAAKVIAIWYTLTVIYATYELLRQYKIRTEYTLAKAAFAMRKMSTR